MDHIKVIGISGISGAGKSTLVEALAENLNATSLFWDDFDAISRAPEDYIVWYNKGADFSEFDYAALAQVLESLKKSTEYIHPVSQKKLEATDYIIVDAPLGKAHKQTAQYIDIFFHIDTPLDIALARRIIRDSNNPSYDKAKILHDLKSYLKEARPLFDVEANALIENQADFIIDGSQNTEKQISYIKNALEEKKFFIEDIKFEVQDSISHELETKMRNSLIEYERQNGIDVNYKHFSLILSRNKKSIGVLNAYTAFSEVYVDDIWVDSEHRSKGYGSRLLKELEHHFKGKGFNNINLVTSAFQAEKFYEKCGFKKEFKRINERNPKLTKTFFVKFFGEEIQEQGILK